jgi:predicted short-subunit dehydrogenase-like oxidoreductase (DUF2520 family)
VKAHSKEGNEYGVPEGGTLHVAEQGEVIEGALAEKSNDTAQRIGLEFYVGVSEYEEFARGSLESRLQRVRFTQPPLWQATDVNNFQLRMVGSELIENLRRGIGGTIVHGDDFEVWIIDGHQRGQSRRQFLLLIAGSENQGNLRAIFIRRGRKVCQPGQPHGSVGHFQTVGDPQKRDKGEEEYAEKMHARLDVTQPQGILAWMTKSLAIIGPGRVGRALGQRLRENGWRITVVAARSQASAKRGVRFIGGGRPVAGIPVTLAASSTILITVPDDVIAGVAGELARNAGEELRGRVVLHSSGALDACVLDVLRSYGAYVGSVHPLQTFNGVSVPPLEGKVFAIEGDEPAVRVARRIARSLGGFPVTISADKKPLYHTAGTFAAGLLLALEEAGVRMLMTAGLKRREAQRALLSLTRQVLEHYEKLGSQKAWTGPLARGDFGVVAAHEKALRAMPSEFLEAYCAVNRLAAQVLARDPESMLRELEAIAESSKPIAKAKGGYE